MNENIKNVSNLVSKAFSILVSSLWTILAWFITTFGGAIVLVVVVIVLVVFGLLHFFFQPLIPYNKQDVLFESYLVAKGHKYYDDFVNKYKRICGRSFYENLTLTGEKEYTGNITICKSPINLVPVYNNGLENKEQLIRGATIEKIAEQLGKIMIFKNWISGKYKITRINTNKIRIIGEDKDGNIDTINFFNPFLLENSWIFVDDEPVNFSINGKGVTINRYIMDFQNNSEEQEISKVYAYNNSDMRGVNIERYSNKWKYKIFIPPRIKWNYNAKQKYISNFKKQYSNVISNTFNQLEKGFERIEEKGVPKTITICFDKPIKIPYFIKYNNNSYYNSINEIERYNQYGLVCITIKNIYSKLTREDSGRTSSFIVRLGQTIDADIKINVYNLTYVYNNLVKKYGSKVTKSFLNHYGKQLKDDFQYYYLLKGYMRNFNVDKDFLDFIYDKKNKKISYTLANQGYIWSKHKIDIIKYRLPNYKERDVIIDRKDGRVDEDNTYDLGYWNDFTIENLYFSYLNNLLFNIGDKNIMQDLDKQPEYLFNFGNLYDKNVFNFYYWYLVDQKVKAGNSFWDIFSLSNNKDKLSIRNFYNYGPRNLGNHNTYFNQVITKYNLPYLRGEKSLSLSLFNASDEIDQIGISPLFMFFQIPLGNEKNKQLLRQYYQTNFEHFNYLFNVEKFKKIYKDIYEVLSTNYIKSRFDTDDSNNFDLASLKGLARLYPHYDSNGKIRIIADYINSKRQIEDSLKEYIQKQLTGFNISQVEAITITTKILMDNDFLHNVGCKKLDLKNTVNFLANKKANTTFYRVNFWKDAANNILCFFGNSNACKVQQQTKLAKCDNAVFKLYSFIAAAIRIKQYLQDLVNFGETHKIKNFTLLNTVFNKSYLFHHTYFFDKVTFSDEILSNDYFTVLGINIFDKNKVKQFEKKLVLINYSYGKVTDKFLSSIQNIECKQILREGGFKINDNNINTCIRTKTALIKYLKSGVTLSQAKQFLTNLIKSNKVEQILQVLVNYGLVGQCTRFVQNKYPEINFGGNAKEWCENASIKGWPVYYNAGDVFTGAVVVRNWGEYGHVGIVERIDKKHKQILINDMNWKGPFIETHHWMKIFHPNFKCYIKIR